MNRFVIALTVLIAVLSLTVCTRSLRAADDEKKSAEPKPLASEELGNGALVEVMSMARHSDGLVTLVLRYRNPSKETIHLFGSDAGRDLPGKLYMIDESAKTKYSVSKVKETNKKGREAKGEQPLASRIPSTRLEPGQPQYFWAKFPVPAEVTKVTLYVPDAPPMESLAITPTGENSSASAQPAGEKSEGQTSAPIATAPNNKGARVDVTRIRRTGDGFVEIRWQYTNPGEESMHLLGSDDARDLPHEMYVIDPESKKLYGVVTDTKGEPIASKLDSTSLGGGKSLKVWGRFPVDASAKHVTLYLPETLPLEDLPIEANAK